ncbi:MAG: EAL domain-containing protein [Lachnospiraceae bacterium]|nr:EAL domain-containing protein [Lachnospiraceae bacterium]
MSMKEKKESVLIVDDQKINCEILRSILEETYQITESYSGEEALTLLRDPKQQFSVILLDIVMPGMDGFDVLKILRNDTRLSKIPVVIETESTEDVFEENALKYGAMDYVTKPFRPETIKVRVANVIRTRHMLEQISQLDSDELTGLMSLNNFYYEGARWIAENPDMEFDLVAEDIAHFSVINDSKGVDGANAILKALADRAKQAQGQVKFLCSRVYADRFVFLFQRRDGYLDRLMMAANELAEEFSDRVNIQFKFGVYEITDKTQRLPEMCGRAFSAIGSIRGQYGTASVFYDEKLHDQIVMEERINDEMVSALENKQFEVYLQPKYDLFTNSIAGAEALIRWIHPTEGMISPGVFIPIFEKNGFIVDVDHYVWEQTAAIISKWYKAGEKTNPVSVNVSRIDIENSDIVKVLTNIVDKYDLEPELLHLEITESAYVQDSNRIIEVVRNLKDKGFIIEMDDFGSGYSSLNMLAKLPIDILKLDMKFIQAIENSTNAKTIIEYTIGLAKWMNLPVVAEGVETEEQLELLRKFECNYVQGFIFAKPMSVPDFEKQLQTVNRDDTLACIKDKELYFYDNHKKYTMMLVEDLQLNRSIIRSYFEENFSIVEAPNGRIALD